MTDLQREHNGRTILELCELGDRILASYGIPPERAKVECDGCGGSGLVPANSGSETAKQQLIFGIVVSLGWGVGVFAVAREMSAAAIGAGLLFAGTWTGWFIYRVMRKRGVGREI